MHRRLWNVVDLNGEVVLLRVEAVEFRCGGYTTFIGLMTGAAMAEVAGDRWGDGLPTSSIWCCSGQCLW
jgi:hypothetical protein